MQTILISKKIYEVNFETYIEEVIKRNHLRYKHLKPQQIRFLAYPFITSVFCVHKISKDKDTLEFSDNYAKTFYVDENKPFQDEEGYYFYGGEVAVKLSLAEEITKKEYDVLERFQYK